MVDEQPNKPWLYGDDVSVLGDQHRLPRNPEKWLPKYNPDEKIPMEDHIKYFVQAMRLRNVIHEDIVYRLSLIILREKLLLGISP